MLVYQRVDLRENDSGIYDIKARTRETKKKRIYTFPSDSKSYWASYFKYKMDIQHYLSCVFIVSFLIPECVARVPVSLWGSGG